MVVPSKVLTGTIPLESEKMGKRLSGKQPTDADQ